MRRLGTVASAVVTLVVLAGCTSSSADDDPAGSAPADAAGDQPVTAAPEAPRTLVADTDPVAAAVSTSRALFAGAPVAVVAGRDDPSAQLLGAVSAVGLGVPLLLGADGSADALAPELDRLGVRTVLAVGDDAAAALPDDGVEVVTVPAQADAVAEATGLDLDADQPVAEADRAAAVAALAPDALPALSAEGAAALTGAAEPAGELPAVDRPEPLEDVVVLAGGGGDALAGIATARAAGAEVLLTGTDPRSSEAVVERLAQQPTVVVLGADLAGAPGIDWKLDTAATGTQLPGGGQLLFPQHMLVALYGIPGSGALGVLGEQDLPAAIERAEQTAEPYRALVGATVVPTFEIIATVASEFPGADGNYSAEGDVETLRPWVEAAGAAGLYVVLDLQPGRTDFLTQAKEYQSLLELPHVGLALDPEWRLEPGQVHLAQIGQVGIDEVNTVVTWLADLTREKALPQKLLVLHQFQVRMIIDRERLDTSRDELAIMVHADGQGGQAAKQDTWRVLHQDAPPTLSWGWKNFVDEDSPMLTPEQTIEQVLPTPQLVTYQ
ncbi:Putative lipoprotein [Modestobacter italicus]|uniref:Lipoprotein n=1 Tax=Modestobacter italicus (strain DSM 44449 / CECT 9708 / BC 501) TaxID=2732864 RepID=I4EUE8_MODI5|nr:hypothetical protein [Modestobacter marinus]CCH87011.1 Putative lipoprotein [Modestobacter marinus]